MIRAMLIDDEPLARERLRALLEESATPVEIVGEAGSGSEALPMIHELKPDVIFLDIQMPVLDGFDVLDLLPSPRPQVVFVTAYDQHAIRAFEVHALDYLLKPVRLGRLNQTLARLEGEEGKEEEKKVDALVRDRGMGLLARLTVHAGRKLRVVPLEEIRWIEAREKLVFVHIAGGHAYPTDFTLDELETRLDPARFLRTHRSIIVNASLVRELVPWFAGTYVVKLDDGTQLPVARRRVREVRDVLGG